MVWYGMVWTWTGDGPGPELDKKVKSLIDLADLIIDLHNIYIALALVHDRAK